MHSSPDAMKKEPYTKSPPGPIRRKIAFIVAVALLIRLIVLPQVQSWPIGPDSPIWKSGLEIVNIARALASHQGFSSPFGVPTGPTAWIPPVYPVLLSLIFLVFGLKSGISVAVIFILQALFSAVTCAPIYGIGNFVFGRRVGLAAAWAWALFPYAVLVPVLFIWETALSALLLSIVCYCCLRLHAVNVISRVAIGMLWGIAALTNTALLAVLPVFFVCHFNTRLRVRLMRIWVPALLGFVLTTAPWLWRDWHALHTFVPIRSNFAEEFWLGNHGGGSGRIAYGLNPGENKQELERYRSLGEIKYLANRRREAVQFVCGHPDFFLRFIWYRIQYWWYVKGERAPVYLLYIALSVLSLGGAVLAFVRKTPGARLLAVCVLVYPVLYYLTDVYARYRYPVEPLMVLLGTFFVLEMFDSWRSLNREKPSHSVWPASLVENP